MFEVKSVARSGHVILRDLPRGSAFWSNWRLIRYAYDTTAQENRTLFG